MRGLLVHALAALVGNKLCDVGLHSWQRAREIEVCCRPACRGRTWRRVHVLDEGEVRPRFVRAVGWGDKFNDEGGK